MQTLREIRRKIRSVQNIEQITQAMKMVAAAKLRRVQARVTAGKPYFEKMQVLMECVGPQAREVDHPLLRERAEIRHSGLVVVTGNRGLCGSYNANLLREAFHFLQRHPTRNWRLLVVGRKAFGYFPRHGYEVVDQYEQLDVTSTFTDAKVIIDAVTSLYSEERVDELYIAYTEFITTMQQRPRVTRFLPLEAASPDEDGGPSSRAADQEFIFEPAAPQLMAALLPRFVDTQLYHMLLEALTSEFGARMTAMSAATDNAGEMIKDLTLLYNRSRQAAITKEILDIVGGAEALVKS